MVDCKDDSSFIVTTGDAFSFVYPEYNKYFISMELVDQYANIASKRWTLNTTTGLANA
jgi:hypothetical protein